VGDLLIAAGASMFVYKAVSRPRTGTEASSPGAGGSTLGGSGGFKGIGDLRRVAMFADRMHRLIGRALTDPHFRERLLRSPAEAVRDLPLTRLERSVVASLRASSLEEFSRKLDQKLEEVRPPEEGLVNP